LTGQEALKRRLVFRLLSVTGSEIDLVGSFKDYNKQANFLGCSRTTGIFEIVIETLQSYHTNASVHYRDLCTLKNLMDAKPSDTSETKTSSIPLPTRLLHDK